MKSITASNTQNRTLWLIVALALVLLMALMIPGLAWADHSSDHPESQFDLEGELSGEESASAAAVTYSGDDDYDPAAGGEPERSVAAISQQSESASATSLSGDDDYDPAAGGEPEQSVG